MAIKRTLQHNETKVVFHGSDSEIKESQILMSGYAKDFGFAFYCTELEKQAIRRAYSKAQNKTTPIVNIYNLEIPKSLNVKSFTLNDEWLDFVVNCRNSISHPFDIVEGPMADDRIYNYVEDFASGKISRQAFWELAKFNYPTHQIAFCTQRSLDALHFIQAKKYANTKYKQKRTEIKR